MTESGVGDWYVWWCNGHLSCGQMRPAHATIVKIRQKHAASEVFVVMPGQIQQCS